MAPVVRCCGTVDGAAHVTVEALANRVPQGRVRAWVAANRGLAAFGGLWLLMIATFLPFGLRGIDAARPYRFLRAMFGQTKTDDAYQFGLALFEAPFYAAGLLLKVVGLRTVTGLPVASGMVALGLALLVLVIAYLVVRLLEGLELPRRGLATGIVVFGSPLFFYGILLPGKTHVVDALLFAALALLMLEYFRNDVRRRELAVAMGLVVGVTCSVRYFNGAEAVGLTVGLLWYRRWRDTAAMAATTAATLGLLALLPWLMTGDVFAKAAGEGLSTTGGNGLNASLETLRIAPLNPLRLLFSTRYEGLFVWYPITILATVGYVRLLLRRQQNRPFLVVAGVTALTIGIGYAFAPWSSGRYMTSVVPLFAIGIASLLDWRPRLTAAIAALGVAWSVWLVVAFALVFDYRYQISAFEMTARVADGRVSLHDVGSRIYCQSRVRYVFRGLTSC